MYALEVCLGDALNESQFDFNPFLAESFLHNTMGKSSSLMKTLCEYSEVSTVHGISYVFSRSLNVSVFLLFINTYCQFVGKLGIF